MKLEKININDLVSPDYNPRTITPEAMESLKTSLKEFDYIDPLIVNRHNNHVVGGNQRLIALKELGYTEVDVIFINEPDINREKQINIRLNNNSGEWDNDQLTQILEDLELQQYDISLTGFDNLEEMVIDLDNDYLPTSETEYTDKISNETELPTGSNNNNDDADLTEHEQDTYAGGLTEDEVTVKIGDVYLLGDHRLMCGDSSDKNNIDILINSEQIDLILTDPPYGINIVTTNGKIGGGANQ